MKNDKTIVLSEQELNALVEDSVKNIMIQEGIWSGIKNSARSLFNGNFRNMGQAYSQGSWAGSINRYYQTAASGLQGMQKIMQKSGDQQASNVIQQIIQNLSNVVQNYQSTARNTSNKAGMVQSPKQMQQIQQQMMQQPQAAGQQPQAGQPQAAGQQPQAAQGGQQRQIKQNGIYNNSNMLNNGLGVQPQQPAAPKAQRPARSKKAVGGAPAATPGV
jgi:hypothetical protein